MSVLDWSQTSEREGLSVPTSLALAKQLTVEQHQGLLERQRVPDLHLAVRTLQDVRRKKEHEGGSLLDALQHAFLGQVVGTVVVPRL